MYEFNMKKQDILNMNKLNEVKVGWMCRIDILHKMVDVCSLLEEKKTMSFLKSLILLKN